MSGLFGSITIKGNRLTEFASQTSTVGIPIPFGFGRFPCEGNIIFAPMPPKEHVKKKKQGKGGVKTEEYSYTLSYAIAFCEGPIYGYWTIKRNGKVVWTQDPDASVDDKAYAAKWAQKATFYYGTETQLPDSTIESYKGAGQVSGHRGIAYIVVEDDDVTDNGGAVPTYEAVVIASPPEIFITSPPYQYRYEDQMRMNTTPDTGFIRNDPADNMDFDITPQNGLLYSYVKPYTIPSDDRINMNTVPLNGILKSVVLPYAIPPNDKINMNTVPLNGTLDQTVVPYTIPQEDRINMAIIPLNGTLS